MKRLLLKSRRYLRSGRQIDWQHVERYVAAVCAAFLIWLGLTFALEFWGKEDEPYRWWGWLKQDTVDLRSTALFALTLLFLFALPRIWRFFRRWAAWRKVGSLDVGLASFILFEFTTALSSGAGTRWRASILATIATAFLLLRLPSSSRTRRTVPSPLFDQTLGSPGFGPLLDFSQDQLERGPLLDALTQLVAYKRKVSVSFGLEGSWGSGKTTLLNALERRLAPAGHVVVRFDAWSYRRSERLVRSYFDLIERSLSRFIAVPGLRRQLYKFASGLVEIGGGRLAAIGGFLGARSGASEDELREEIGITLMELNKPVVVLVDDLDRLDGDELKAVLRAIRLVSGLPNLTHVLAYDREQISNTLFPEDPNGTRARDYLGKLVNIELSIGEPTSHALPTPREIRRVAAAAAWHWNQMERHVNIFDLFIMSALQYTLALH
jgi:KAP-like P-loop domain-containing protein